MTDDPDPHEVLCRIEEAILAEAAASEQRSVGVSQEWRAAANAMMTVVMATTAYSCLIGDTATARLLRRLADHHDERAARAPISVQ